MENCLSTGDSHCLQLEENPSLLDELTAVDALLNFHVVMQAVAHRGRTLQQLARNQNNLIRHPFQSQLSEALDNAAPRAPPDARRSV